MDEQRILFRDEHCLAVNKLPGELSQGDRRGPSPLLEQLAAFPGPRKKRDSFFQPVHRLDRPASGVLLFALTKVFFTAMTGLFQRRQVEKTYWAVAEGRPDFTETELSHHLVPDRRRNIVRVRPELPPNAFLHCRVAGWSDRYVFLILRPHTGLQHQIRAQLRAAGLPIKGDVKYGARRGQPDRGICLHARELAFTHPLTGRAVRLTAPPPAGVLWDLFPRKEAGPGRPSPPV